MRVLVQWAVPEPGTPADWETIDHTDWPTIASDFVNAINIQGILFSGDHYAIDEDANGDVRVTVWNDDPAQFDPDEFSAHVITIPQLCPDENLGNAINTCHTHVLYAGAANIAKRLEGGWEAKTLLAWSTFVAPTAGITRHGLLLTDPQFALHEAAQSEQGWRTWTEGLDPSEIENGKVKQQRAQGRYKPNTGTRTYYHRDTNRATGVHAAFGTDEENAFEIDTGTVELESSSPTSAFDIAFVITTPSGEPDSGAWPTGDYRHQIDCNQVSANSEYGLRGAGDAQGHFARVNTGLTSDLESHEQTESLFTTSGLKLATTGSVSWSSGTDTDRFECVIALNRVTGHDPIRLRIDVNETDDFADGPWDNPIKSASGTSAGVGVATSADARIRLRSATSAGVGAVASDDVRIRVRSGTSAGTGATASDDARIRLRSATSAGVATATGEAEIVSNIKATSGTSAGIGAAASDDARIRLRAGTSAGVGAATSDDARVRLRSGTSAGVGATASDDARIRVRSGTSAGTSTATGEAALVLGASGSSAGVGTASGDRERIRLRSGSSAGVGTATSDDDRIRQRSGTSAGVGATASDDARIRARSGTSAGVATPTGEAEIAGAFLEASGTSAGVGTATPDHQRIRQRSGTSAGRGRAISDDARVRVRSGTSAGVGAATATAALVLGVSGSSAGTSTADGDRERIRQRGGTSAGTSTADADAGRTRIRTGTSAGVGATVSDDARIRVRSGTSAGTSTAVGEAEIAAAEILPTSGTSAGVAIAVSDAGRIRSRSGTSAGVATAIGVIQTLDLESPFTIVVDSPALTIAVVNPSCTVLVTSGSLTIEVTS